MIDDIMGAMSRATEGMTAAQEATFVMTCYFALVLGAVGAIAIAALVVRTIL